jgi:hypothetical protein
MLDCLCLFLDVGLDIPFCLFYLLEYSSELEGEFIQQLLLSPSAFFMQFSPFFLLVWRILQSVLFLLQTVELHYLCIQFFQNLRFGLEGVVLMQAK